MSDQSQYPGTLDTFKTNWRGESPGNPNEPGRSLGNELNRMGSAIERMQADIGKTDTNDETSLRKKVANLEQGLSSTNNAVNNINVSPTKSETLQNKIISGDNNTIRDLNFDSFNAGLKVNLLNGNATHQQIISAKALYDFLQPILFSSKTVTLIPFNTTGAINQLRYNISTNRLNTSNYNKYEWQVPAGFNEIVSAKIIHVPDSVETISLDQWINKDNTVIATDTSLTKVVTVANTKDEIDVTNFFKNAPITAGDYIGYQIKSNISYAYIGALVIEYK